MTTTYYVSTKRLPPTLLKRAEDAASIVDEALVGGRWEPTRAIELYKFGEDDFVNEVTDDQAAALAAEG